jgi:CHAT domain-containing protein
MTWRAFEDEAGGTTALQPDPTAVTLERVAATLPRDAALVEIAQYLPMDLQVSMKPGPLRYAAFILEPDGSVAYADLGDAKTVDADVTRFRAALADPRTDPKPIARTLDERVMRPLQQLLGTTRRLFVAPDSALSVVPFGALVDQNGEYRIKHWSFTYLTTGRELLHLVAPHETTSRQPVVLADPDFGPFQTPPAGTGGSRLDALRTATFEALPATRREGQTVAAALGAQLLVGPDATDAAVADLHGPRVLHLATHGFTFDEPPSTEPEDTRGLALAPTRPSRDTIDGLLLDGLAFSGANQHRPGQSGILSAATLAWLNLAGTELVVLSACDSGLGETGFGTGVYGLQQAFITAGARSLVMSLWMVDDKATTDLMVDFYGALARGAARSEALREAELKMLADPARAHPFYWASFIHYGDGSPLPLGDAVRAR